MGLEASLKASIKCIPHTLLCYILHVKAKIVLGFFGLRRQEGG
jgi:hypothetical protein